MKKLLFKLLIILSFTSLNSISAYSAVATGLATTYKLTITKMELCETGSTGPVRRPRSVCSMEVNGLL